MHGAFLVFDLSNKRSFDRLKQKWFPDLINFLGEQECSKIIIGNKSDLEQVCLFVIIIIIVVVIVVVVVVIVVFR